MAQSKDMFGKNGGDLTLKVPLGTVVTDLDTGEVIADLNTPDAKVVIARGGIGGRGNAHFATSIHQAPKFAEKGEPGEHKRLKLELQLLADVGLLGFPNVGKSTLIAAVSAAKPKIANYPFTTLVPNLGVVRVEAERNFVMADIPGIIEGAHEGVGLGPSVPAARLPLAPADPSAGRERHDRARPARGFRDPEPRTGLYDAAPGRPAADRGPEQNRRHSGSGARWMRWKWNCKIAA